jgi:NAD(P)-dependent dehydrogenase (short-subunit alcohol dehydrogenase family)
LSNSIGPTTGTTGTFGNTSGDGGDTLHPAEESTGALAGKVAVVTGAAQGIGEGIAALFAREGASLVLADVNAERGHATAEQLQARGAFGEIIFRRCDVAHAAQVRGLMDAAMHHCGRIDVLVNNAGYAVYKGVEETTEGEWEKVLGVNLSAFFYTIKYAAPHLRKSHGTVVNIASVRALVTTPGVFAYTAAKAGVLGLTRAAALDLAPDVRVNAILPGAIDTPMHRENVAATMDVDEGMRMIRDRIPMKRHGQPADIARAALFLATEASSWSTGGCFAVDGGQTAVIP